MKTHLDSNGKVRGYSIKRGNSTYKSSELGKGRCLMPLKIEKTWEKLHHQNQENTVLTSPKQGTTGHYTQMQPVTRPLDIVDRSSVMRHFDFSTDEFHQYPVNIPQGCLDVIDNNITLDADNVFVQIGDVQKTAILLFAEYIDAATTIAVQSGGGGATSGWGRDKYDDDQRWAYRCAMMANHLCRPRRKRGYGR